MPIGCLTSNSFSEQTEMLETTTRDNPNGWKTYVPTFQNYNISFNGLVTDDYQSDVLVTFTDLIVYKRYKQLIEWRSDDGKGSYDTGTGYIINISDAANIDEFISFDCSITGFGSPNNAALDALLQEDGYYVLNETNGKIIL